MDNHQDLFPLQKKHLPLIEAPDKVRKGEFFDFKVVINKDMTGSDKTDAQRFWFTVYFLPQDSGIPYQVVKPLFATQEEPEEKKEPLENSILYQASFQFKTEKTGNIYAAAYCPVHGLSQSRSRVEVI